MPKGKYEHKKGKISNNWKKLSQTPIKEEEELK